MVTACTSQEHKIPHHVEKFSRSWEDGHLMIWSPELVHPVPSQQQHVRGVSFARMRLRTLLWFVVWVYGIGSTMSAVSGSASKLKTLTGGYLGRGFAHTSCSIRNAGAVVGLPSALDSHSGWEDAADGPAPYLFR